MKKLLSMIGAITLIGTASTIVIACGGIEIPNPISKQKIDISTKISNSIVLGQLFANTKSDFLAKLQTALTRITDLNTITTNDYDVYKAGTTIEIQNSDITAGDSLNIKIVAKGSKFKGNKDNITVTYIKKDNRKDLSKITNIDSPSKIESVTPNSVTKEELEYALDSKVSEAILSKIWNFIGEKGIDYTYDIKNVDGSAFTNIDLSTNSKKILIKIIAESTSTAAIGHTEPIDVNLPVAIQGFPTTYIDENGKQTKTIKHDLSLIESKNIIQIGYFINNRGENQVVKMPKIIEKLPDQLPFKITCLNEMFYESEYFNQDISSWDTSNITDMSLMFKNATSFNQDISSWDTSNVKDMFGMFAHASSFNQNIKTNGKKWNISKVKNIYGMFAHASSFNQDISSWDTSNVTDMSKMFLGARKFNQNISNWNVSNVNKYYGFAIASGIFHDKNKWPKFRENF